MFSTKQVHLPLKNSITVNLPFLRTFVTIKSPIFATLVTDQSPIFAYVATAGVLFGCSCTVKVPFLINLVPVLPFCMIVSE